ncbi:MAG: hypothetical protein H0W53_14660 [Acidobacteria bacterium]|nr:hypothetical protein [Acidobacteriota bacterium]
MKHPFSAIVSFNQIVEITLIPDLSGGGVDAVVTSPYFQVPTTVAAFGGRLVAVNAKYDTGFSADSGDVRVVTVRKP